MTDSWNHHQCRKLITISQLSIECELKHCEVFLMGRPQTRSIHFQVSSTDFLGDSCHILAPIFLGVWNYFFEESWKSQIPPKRQAVRIFWPKKIICPLFVSLPEHSAVCLCVSSLCKALVRWISINEGRGSIEQRYDSRRTQHFFSWCCWDLFWALLRKVDKARQSQSNTSSTGMWQASTTKRYSLWVPQVVWAPIKKQSLDKCRYEKLCNEKWI